MNQPVWHPNEDQIKSSRLYNLMSKLGFSCYDEFLKASINNIEWFWHESEKALGIEWFTPYEKCLELENGIKWPKWFVGGQLNIVFSLCDKWANSDETADLTALICENEAGKSIHYSYRQLNSDVSNASAGLKALNICKGDRVAVFMPMVYECVVAMLAILRIGAIFLPTFSGFAAEAVSKRLNGSAAKMLITVDGFHRRGKVVAIKEVADKAIALSPSIEKCIVVPNLQRDMPWNSDRDIHWQELQSLGESFDSESPERQIVAMDSSDPCMLLYTSGTTQDPKGIVHTHSGFPIKSAFDAAFGMDLKQNDVLFWVTDMGWMMGPFVVFGALINGATAVLYEGSVDFPRSDRLWKMVEAHAITHLGISPTLVRLLMKEEEHAKSERNLTSLRVICSTGEPWNYEPWMWLFNEIGDGKIPIFNYSGGTEISGGVLGNVLIKPIAPVCFNSPLPGMDIDVFADNGTPIRDAIGELVIKQPWVGMASGFWNDPNRYVETYWNRWPDIWAHSDLAKIDSAGFWTILGRSDDTLKIGGKRIGPVEIESLLVKHDDVVESGAIGAPNELKGEVAICFVVLKSGVEATDELKVTLLNLVAEGLGKALRPHDLFFIRALPKTRNGKIVRRMLRSAYLDLDPGDVSMLENPEVLKEIRAASPLVLA